MKYSQKSEFIKERWGGLTFKLWRGFRVPLLNSEGDPGSRVPGLSVPSPGILVPLSHHAFFQICVI